jgi:hypothetical protein
VKDVVNDKAQNDGYHHESLPRLESAAQLLRHTASFTIEVIARFCVE